MWAAAPALSINAMERTHWMWQEGAHREGNLVWFSGSPNGPAKLEGPYGPVLVLVSVLATKKGTCL